MYTNLYLPKKMLKFDGRLELPLSRRWRKIPAINNPIAELLWPQDLSNTKNYPNTGLLHLTQRLGNTKNTQTLIKYPKERLNPAFGVKKIIFFCFHELLFKWKYISSIGLYIRYNSSYLYYIFFSARRSAAGAWWSCESSCSIVCCF